MSDDTTVYVVRSFGRNDATARLHSQPLLNGLEAVSSRKVHLTPPTADEVARIGDGAWIVFHYNDFPAIDAIRRLKRSRAALRIACLCSDVYSFTHYTSLEDIADVFVAPTEAHRRVLAYQLVRPVQVVPEAIDTVIPPAVDPPDAPGDKAVVWFGYAESFAKSMTSVLPVLRAAIQRGQVDGIRVLTDLGGLSKAKLDLTGFTLQAYSGDRFFDDVRTSTYAILSHMPLDLDLNSLIKSPNKLVTALACGLVPLCSDTPNYAELLRRFGLDDYVYSSPSDLATMLSRLDPVQDRIKIARSGIVAFIRDEFSDQSVAARFVQVMEGVATDAARAQPAPTPPVARISTLREHLADLVPSARRMMSGRLARWRAHRRASSA